MMTTLHHRARGHSLASIALLAATAAAQGDFLLTYSQPELTTSGSGGTVLGTIHPNEIAVVEWSNGPCASLSAEKWAPRTCFHAMGGDADGDGCYWDPAIFGEIDALLMGLPTTPVGGGNQRTVFWSPSAALGTNISGPPGLRPGDVGRIVRTGAGDGQIDYFMTREQFNQALGLPLATPIDVDAIAFAYGKGVYFSLDQDIAVLTQCGPHLLRDGDVMCVPHPELTYTVDKRIATVTPASAVVIYDEAAMDTIVNTARITDRFGVCVPAVVDVEALEIDPFGPSSFFPGCFGYVIERPTLLFAGELMSGAGLCSTAGGGQIYNGTCATTGTTCGNGPTLGPQLGIQPAGLIGAPSHVNALASVQACRYVLEPQNHVLYAFPSGLPAGATTIDMASPFPLNYMLVTIVPPTVPSSAPAFPLSLWCFPDFYPTPIFYGPIPVSGGFGTKPMFAIPPNTTAKVLFQALGFGGTGFELSTPAIVDVK